MANSVLGRKYLGLQLYTRNLRDVEGTRALQRTRVLSKTN